MLFIFNYRQYVLLTCVLFLVAHTASGKTISADRLGMIPSDETYADYNANKLVSAFNQGYKVKIKDTYHLGTADAVINNDIRLKGSGTLILESSQCFTITSPISIILNGITISTSQIITSKSQVKFITNKGQNYHNKISIKKCRLSGIRLYTHVAEDVDQITTRDGVRIFEFENNYVENVVYYLLRLDNCLCESATIKNNRIYTYTYTLLSKVKTIQQI